MTLQRTLKSSLLTAESSEVPFWKCIDETLHKDGLDEWAGRACCHLAETENCRIGCTQALQLPDLNQTCRYSDEVMLFDCAERKQRGEECCTLARSSECHAACRKSLVSRRVTREDVDARCSGGVSSCMDRLNRPKHAYMSKMRHCCLRTSNAVCQEKCQKLIDANTIDVEFIQELTYAGCGMVSVLPMENNVEQMWMCFMSNPELQKEAGRLDPNSGSYPAPAPVVGASSSFNGALFSPAGNLQGQHGFTDMGWTGPNRNPDQYPGNTGYPGYPGFPQPGHQYPGGQFPDPNSPYPNPPYPGNYPNQFPGGNVYPGNNYPVNPYPGGSRPGDLPKLPPSPPYPGRKPFNNRPVSNNIAEVGLDVNKLYCCMKAVSTNCRQLCYQSYSNAWSDYSTLFNRDCLGNATESALAECDFDVDDPCEPGCDGLHFCSNYNKSPDLFRSCNPDADNAQALFSTWVVQGFIEIPQFPEQKIYVKNISNCSPVMWKSVVCALQVKPCHKKNHSNKICRADCYSLLSSCLIPDRTRGIDANSVCKHLSPMDLNEPCIGLKDFLQTTVTKKPPRKIKIKGTIRPSKGKPVTILKGPVFNRSTFSPCSNHTCNPMQMCEVNKACEGSYCPPYLCIPGCKMGEISNQQVPTNTYISLLDTPNPDQPCFKMCRCSPQGTFPNCLQKFCITNNNYFCKKNDQPIGHGQVVVDAYCNQRCICHWGDLVCDKRVCTVKPTPSTDIVVPSVSSQCKAADTYAPICVNNGLTLPNEEFATCLGYQKEDYVPGTCYNSCLSNPCLMGETCINTPKVCLYTNYKEIRCPQHECVRRVSNCPIDGDPVCTKDGFTYNNSCHLVMDPSRRQFDYKGKCLSHCSRKGPVCGVDGVTYDSECQANARYIKMDYMGPCRQLGSGLKKYRCPGVKCPEGLRSFCSFYVPPGACCPTCDGALRVAFSQRIIDRAADSLGPAASQEVFTVESVVAALDRHIKVANCRLFGHLTFDKDLILLVSPWLMHSSKYDVEPCMAEAEKLAVLIDSHNPRILSITSTSPLVLASVQHQFSFSPSVVPKIFMLLLPVFTYFFR